MQSKVDALDEAVNIVHDGDILCFSGVGTNGVPEALAGALLARFQRTGAPRSLTFGSGPGDGGERGMNLLAEGGLFERAIGGNRRPVPRTSRLAPEKKIEAYNLPPRRDLAHLPRDCPVLAGHRHARWAWDLRQPALGEDGAMNARATEDFIDLWTSGAAS